MLGAVGVVALLAQLPATASPQPIPALWLIGADGTDPHQVNPDVEFAFGFDWSPDGALLAYASGDIWVLDVATGESVNLTATSQAFEDGPTWSPDGTRLAYEDDGDVWVMDADGSDRVQLTEGPAWDTGPEWAPAGDAISYSRYREGQAPVLHVIDGGGGQSRALAETASAAVASSWSPDGSEIAYASPSSEIRVVDVATGTSDPIAPQGHSPAWAPAGDRIAYGSPDGLFVASRADRSSTRLFDDPVGQHSAITWSPDGSELALTLGSIVAVVDAVTGDVTPLTGEDGTEWDQFPRWSPSGEHVAYVGTVWCCLPHFWDRWFEVRATGHLVLRGHVYAGLDACSNGVRVHVRRAHGDGWRTVWRGVTAEDGSFRAELRDRPGRFRAVTPRQEVVYDGTGYTCLRSLGEVLRHRH